MNMYIVIVFNLKWQGVWRRDPLCARRHNKEYLLHSPLTIESSTLAFHGINSQGLDFVYEGILSTSLLLSLFLKLV